MKRIITLFSLLIFIGVSSCKDAEKENDSLEENSEQELRDDEIGDSRFNEFDKNSDGKWDDSEFANSYDSNFSEWDSNNNGSLDRSEFNAVNFRYVDKDRSEDINEDEWNEGYHYLYGTYESDFDIFDADEDGILDTDEWNIGLADSEWFNDFDENDDGAITEEEWENGLFETWDKNQDGFIDDDEYTSQSVYFTSW